MAKRILVVEDEAYNRELYEELLRSKGYDVLSAPDGEMGLAQAQKGGFDLILLDVIMPKKDGISFLKEYQAAALQTKNGPIVMLTVLGDDPLIQNCLKGGASGFLMKSDLTPDQLLLEVEKYLNSPQPPAS